MEKIIKYLQLYMCFFIYSFALVFSKLAAQQTALIYSIMYIFLEVVILGIYAVVWQQILKKFPLVVAMTNKGSTVIFSLLWAVMIFNETITVVNILGAFLIIIGIGLVSWNE